jgi:hypothetical protein
MFLRAGESRTTAVAFGALKSRLGEFGEWPGEERPRCTHEIRKVGSGARVKRRPSLAAAVRERRESHSLNSFSDR